MPQADPFWRSTLSFNPLLRFPDFCAGLIACRAYARLVSSGSFLLGRGYILYLPALALETLAIRHADALPFPLVHNGILSLVHATLILGLALGGGIVAQVLSLRPLLLLGQASYAMYIVHYPLVIWFGVFSRHYRHRTPVGTGAMLVYLAVLIPFSIVLFRVVEEPGRRFLKRFLISDRDGTRAGLILSEHEHTAG